jgi:hypothetical protein
MSLQACTGGDGTEKDETGQEGANHVLQVRICGPPPLPVQPARLAPRCVQGLGQHPHTLLCLVLTQTCQPTTGATNSDHLALTARSHASCLEALSQTWNAKHRHQSNRQCLRIVVAQMRVGKHPRGNHKARALFWTALTQNHVPHICRQCSSASKLELLRVCNATRSAS